jgi:hypothetical protein
MNNTVDYTTDVLELAVDVTKTNQFTETHVKTLDDLRQKKAHPRIYGNLAPKGIKHELTQLVSIADIISDNTFFSQRARFTRNPEMQNIQEDIKANGYSLTELPIMLMRLGDKFIPLEGRTRLEILIGLGMVNIIADVFEETTEANALRFAVSQNAQKKPYGEASFKDVHKAVMTLISMNEINKKHPKFEDLVFQEVIKITTKLKPGQINQIVNDAKNAAAGEQSIISFPQGQGAKEWLTSHEYVDTRGIKYIAVGTFEDKVIRSMIRQIPDMDPTVQEVRLVIHGGTLNSNDPERDWQDRCKGFKHTFMKTLKDISDTFYGGVPIKMDRINLYGAIPMVKSLEDKYPMAELYLFD